MYIILYSTVRHASRRYRSITLFIRAHDLALSIQLFLLFFFLNIYLLSLITRRWQFKKRFAHPLTDDNPPSIIFFTVVVKRGFFFTFFTSNVTTAAAGFLTSINTHARRRVDNDPAYNITIYMHIILYYWPTSPAAVALHYNIIIYLPGVY